ncbi:uncharacterized protein LOC135089678 isoform X2 [Scylla paramamosain]|uniref:uncharacterized protein LOC135089678 isoform X2 n=1 Tax=Scylla paramamosain TaxID=85552 RepID=UPI003082B333
MVAVVLLVLATAALCVALGGSPKTTTVNLSAVTYVTQEKSRRCPRQAKCNLPAYRHHPCCQSQPSPYTPPQPLPNASRELLPYPPLQPLPILNRCRRNTNCTTSPVDPRPCQPNCSLIIYRQNPCCQPQPLPYPPPQPLPYPTPQPLPYPPPQPLPYPLPQPLPYPPPQRPSYPPPQPLPYPLPQPPPYPPSQQPPSVHPCPLEIDCSMPNYIPSPCCQFQPLPYPLPQPQPYPTPQPEPYPLPQPLPYPLPQPITYPTPQPLPYPTPQPLPYPPPQPIPYPVSRCPLETNCNIYPSPVCCHFQSQPQPQPIIDTLAPPPATWIPPYMPPKTKAGSTTMDETAFENITDPVMVVVAPPEPVQPWYPPPRSFGCGMYKPCGRCPPPPPVPLPCPYQANRRVRRRAQRRCLVDGHCPEGSSCCRSGCSVGGSVCVPSAQSPSPGQRPNAVKVSVVMTSASSQALWFLKTQMAPFVHALPHLLDLELIPYGSVTEDGECQFGLGDCMGNWMVLCAGQHLFNTTAAHLAFTTCLMDHTVVLQDDNFTAIMDAAVQCAVDFPDKIVDLYNCGVSEEGYQLFKDAGQRQQELAAVVTEVPLVALNEVAVVMHGSQMGQFPELLCRELQEESSAQEYCRLIQASQREVNSRE